MTGSSVNQKSTSLKDIAVLFLKLGTFGFGGPAAHMAMMQREVVERKKWISRDRFLDLMGATNLIPGPNSTEMSMHIGQEKAGTRGLIVAGLCFIVPAVMITAILAAAYREYGTLPNVAPFMAGVKPAIVAVVVSAAITLLRSSVKNVELALVGSLTLAACLYGVHEIAALFCAGFYGVLSRSAAKWVRTRNVFLPLMFVPGGDSLVSNASIFWSFLKIGSILYGSGYVLFAYLEAEFVGSGILSPRVLADAIAAGQITPGPVFSAATFVGWQLNGFAGAILATIGVFLPSFVLVRLLNPLAARLRNSPVMASFLDFINVGSVAVILSVTVELGRVSVTDWTTGLIAAASLIILLLVRKVDSVWIILGGGALGYLL